MPLKAPQRRYLRGLAHSLKPVVMLGNKGMTRNVQKELDQALMDHELIKVRLNFDERGERAVVLAKLVESSRAETVATIGGVAVLYRRNDEQPRIALPR